MLLENLREKIRDNFKTFRESKGLSQGAMAEKLGCSQSKVQSIEYGRQTPSPEDLVMLAKLGLDVHWLYTNEGEMLYSREVMKQEVKALIDLLEPFVE